MKKLLTLMFLMAAMIPLSVELYAEDAINTKEIESTITKAFKSEISNESWGKDEVGVNYTDNGMIKVFRFDQNIEGESYLLEDKFYDNVDSISHECIAIVIDDAWAVASKKCRLSVGDRINSTSFKVKTVGIYNLRVLYSKGKKPSADIWASVKRYDTNNLFLIYAIDKNSNPLFHQSAKAKLTYNTTKDIDKFNSNFAQGAFEVNRTNKHKSDTGDAGDAYEDNFSAYYGVERKNYPKTIKSLDEDNKQVLAKLSTTWIGGKELRAGDPLFYVENGEKYLLGFANATNLWDNFSNTRTDKVILFNYADVREIFDKIKSVDPEAAARVEKNLLVK